ncbi:choline transporter-like 2 isoform X2 [Phlebotomus argentipes]|uniref:choline transporter-like 2 isoform X2 n=2 Tax=Phlebotomus argentipes TaxID=94469 RepID=UPI002892EBB7|nr:choline transporter-like 2 isoform X2 [Phlebotomus argentipes]
MPSKKHRGQMPPQQDDDRALVARDYGEPMKYDPNFKGPLKNRSCTDVICLLLFVFFLVGWGVVAYYAYRNGDLDRLLVPTDSQNNRCGVDSNVLNKPYLFFFDLSRCVDITVPINGCPTPQVCVEKCPDEPFLFDMLSQDERIENIRDRLICDVDVDKNDITSHAMAKEYVDNNRCARWYLQSVPFLNRCISDLLTSSCPRIPKSYSGGTSKKTDVFRAALLTTNRDQWPVGQQIDGRSAPESDEPAFRKCEENRRIGREIIYDKVKKTNTYLARFMGNTLAHITNRTEAHQIGQMVVEDVIDSWWQILIALGITMIVSLLFIVIMRWIAAPVIWFSILGVIAVLGYVIYYSATTYIQLRDNPVYDAAPGTNINAIIKSYLDNKNTWLYIMIGVSILLLIILLLVLVLRKRIVIAIALVKEGSKAVSSTTSTIFFPLFPWTLYLLVIAFAVAVGLYLASVGDPVYRVVGLNSTNPDGCVCTGPPEGIYKNGDFCYPSLFHQHCHEPIQGAFFRQERAPCRTASCHFQRIESPKVVGYFHAVNVVGFFWLLFFVSAFNEMVLASAFSTWYWTFHKSDVPFFNVTISMGRTMRYHLGTLAFGSLIITICRIIRCILEYIDHKLKKFDNEVTRGILCCCKCFFWCLEKFLKFLNRNAYIMCAIHGKNFCASARDAFNLLMRNFLRVIALDKVTDFLFFMAKVLISAGMGVATHFFIKSPHSNLNLNYTFVPVIIVAIGSYLIASVFFSVYSMAVDTLFLCFLEDTERNDGSPEKPYFMSKQLMRILGKKNEVPRHRYR